MRKSEARKTSMLALIFIFVISVATVGLLAFADNDRDKPFDAEYIIGQTVELRETSVVSGNSSVLAKPTLISPSGKSYSGDSAVLKEMGLYKILYKNGGNIVKEESFRCVSPLCSVSGNGKVEYRANEATPTVYGLNAELSDGSSFTYNKVLDLNTLSNKELIKLYVVPHTLGYCDFYQINFMLTDIYDSRNYVIVTVNNVTDGYHNGIWDYDYAKYIAYMKAGTLLSIPSGIEYRGTDQILHVGNTYGTSLVCSFCGLGSGTYDMQTMSFVFDYEEKQIKTGGSVVIDLDDPNHFADVWGGFTTGEVKLTVSLSGYRSSSGTIVITDIAGEHVTSEATFYDENPPVVSVDYGEYVSKENVPSGCIGSGYKIFKASATDTYSGNLEVSTRIYFDYLGTKEEVSLGNDSFVPKKQGTYTIEYVATDYCGNSTIETCLIEIDRFGKIIDLTFPRDKVTDSKAGKWVPLADAVVKGGYGEKKVVYEVKSPDGTPCEVVDGAILVVKSGEYEVKAIVTDYVGQIVSKTYAITVTPNDEPVFIDDFSMPRYFMNGYTYDLPILQAYKADGSNLVPITTNVTVKDSAGNRTIDSYLYVPNVTADGTDIKITYSATLNGKTISKEFSAKGYITKKSNGALLMNKFFVNSSGLTVTANAASISFAAGSSGESTTFINPVLANSFSLMMNLASMGNVYEIEFLLEDMVDSKKTMRASIRKDISGQVFFIVNDTENLLRTFYEDTDYYLVFNNNFSRLGLKNKDTGSTLNFSLSEDGIYFLSGMVYLTITFKSVFGNAELLLKNLNGQNLKSMGVDLLAPGIDLFADAVGKKYSIGDTVTVSKAVAADVLDPYVNLSVTVKDSNKNVVVDKTSGVGINGISANKEYSFVIEDLRTYTVVYTATYDDGEKETYQYVVSVSDTQKPSFRLEHKVVDKVNVGGYVYIPKAVGVDDTEGATVVYYYIMTPDGIVHTIDRSRYDGFKVQTKGNYVVRYVTYDGSNNMNLYDYIVVVE